MGVITYSPLAGSWLSGKYTSLDDIPAEGRLAVMAKRFGGDLDTPINRRRLKAAQQVKAVADQHGVPLARFATAWAMEHPLVTSVIIGPRTMDQLEDSLACADLRLDRAALDAVDEIVAPGTDLIPSDPSSDPSSLSATNRRR